MEEVFSLEYIDFGVKSLENGKAKDIEGYRRNFKNWRSFPHPSHPQAFQSSGQARVP